MSPLAGQTSAPEYWRGLEQLAESLEVQTYLEAEFPEIARQPVGSQDRRTFLRLLAGSLALGGVTFSGCRRYPVEQIRPHASRPEGTAPGVPQFYATSFEHDGVATGLLAKCYDGRPIKLEGNPDHPYSLGATTAAMQASVLSLYDPERSRVVLQRHFSADGTPNRQPVARTWPQFETFLTRQLGTHRTRQGEGLAILSQPSSSPTWARLRTALQAALPHLRWFEYQSLSREPQYAGARTAFGQVLRPQYDLAAAQVIVDLDADLLGAHPARLRLARDWATGRTSVDHGTMNRLLVIEPGYSLTGSVADRRLAVSPSGVARCVAYLAARLNLLPTVPDDLTPAQSQFLDQVLADLEGARGASLLATGPNSPPQVQSWVHAINHELGNHGRTITFTEEPLAGATPPVGTIADLSRLLQGNVLQTLVIVGGNPAYDAPADAPLQLRPSEARSLTTIHLSDYDNETSQQCQWSLPAAHFLESWGDGRAWDGTYSVQQPMIQPLFAGRSSLELLAMMTGTAGDGRAAVRATFDQLFTDAGETGWEETLRDGVRRNSQFPSVAAPTLHLDPAPLPPATSAWEVRFVADYKVHDGRDANNGWLQELPDPMTKLTWDNAALISKRDADALGVKMGDVLRLECGEGSAPSPIEIAAYILPGHAERCITLPLGYGRRGGGHIANDVGVDVNSLRDAMHPYHREGVQVRPAGRSYRLACTQLHHLTPSIADFALRARLGEPGQAGLLIHEGLLSDYRDDPQSVHGAAHTLHAAPLFDQPSKFDSPHRWAMAVDLNACIGCSGCVIACQAENNIPIVGKTNVAKNREMHWLRIDRYFKGSLDAPDIVHQPLACAHCENAPCEQVCPVAATVHDSEGLNSMVYNRCIGTRYCANNCPYKVRRFNYFDYQAADPRTPPKPWLAMPDQQPQDISPLKQLLHNPEVTVRMRGVMEKCTYCVQRVVEARITAKNEFAQGLRDSDLVRDGDVQTACQASCPTAAIVFGDLNDAQSAIAQARANARNYELLEELNLKARTTYLAKIRNR